MTKLFAIVFAVVMLAAGTVSAKTLTCDPQAGVTSHKLYQSGDPGVFYPANPDGSCNVDYELIAKRVPYFIEACADEYIEEMTPAGPVNTFVETVCSQPTEFSLKGGGPPVEPTNLNRLP